MRLPKVVVVMPTFNESMNLRETVLGCLEEFRRSSIDGSVLVVDDDSPDGTAEIALELAELTGRVDVMVRKSKRGIGSAYIDGFRHVIRDHGEVEVIVEMDADGSHEPAYLTRLVTPILSRDADVVIGSRYVRGGGWDLRNSRYVISRVANVYARAVTGLRIGDMTSGYRAMSRGLIERCIDILKAAPRSYVFQVDTLRTYASMGAKIIEVPIRFKPRKGGKSKLRVGDVITFLTWGLGVALKRSHDARGAVPPS
ncbi:MAG: polyprenol monophosphomannose synthase [Aigarchaeota archaeon]|nr:polyprenol monophosphomannose synthase [Aigarchaeota archaeon]MDW8092143.1 polyprenol monophosphomannose synthase [Nitrososphaerota archaeon]